MRDIAQFFKVLSDEARVKILWLLFHRDELCVCDIMEVLDVTQSKASRHLATLKTAGLVTDRREGTWSYYALAKPSSAFERSVLTALKRGLSGHDDAATTLNSLERWLAKKNNASCAKAKTCSRGGR